MGTSRTFSNEEIDAFVIANKKGHFMQSPRWGQVKKEWTSRILVSQREDGSIAGTLHVLIRKTPVFGYSLMYAPRGPVCDVHDEKTIADLISQAKALCKEMRCYELKMDPDVPIEDTQFSDLMKKQGFRIDTSMSGFSAAQPHFVFRLNIKDRTEDDIMMGFEKQTRKNVRRAVKFGITSRVGTREDIPLLYEMVEETSRRQGFAHRPIEYFYRLYDAFAPEYARLYVMEYEGEVCCCSLVICYGNKVWSVYSGTSDHHREKKATFLMRMEQIRWGLERGCEIYDLMGVPGEVPEDHPLYGLYAVKRGFGGTLTEFTGEMDLVTNRLIYFLAEHGERTVRSIRRTIKSATRTKKKQQ